MSSQDPAVVEWLDALNPITEGFRQVAEQQAALAAALAPVMKRWAVAWGEVFVLADEAMQEFRAELDFVRDPESDMKLIRAVEEHYGVTFE